MEQSNRIKGFDDFFSMPGTRIVGTQPSKLFTVSEENLWDIVEKVKWLLIDKAHHTIEEHFGNLGTLWYQPQEGYGNTVDSDATYAKNTIMHGERLAGDGTKKKPEVFLAQAIEESKIPDVFSGVKSHIEIYPPGSISSASDGYVVKIPFSIDDIYPPVSHGIERAKYLADIQSYEDFKKKQVDFDMTKLQPVTLDEFETKKLNRYKKNGHFFRIDVVSDQKLSEIVNESIASVYAHLYEYSKGKEVIDQIEEKREILGELKEVITRLEKFTDESPVKRKENAEVNHAKAKHVRYGEVPPVNLDPEIDPTEIEKNAVEDFDNSLKDFPYAAEGTNRSVKFLVDGFLCFMNKVKTTISDEEIADMALSNNIISSRLKEKAGLRDEREHVRVARAATRIVITRGNEIVVNVSYNPEWIKRVKVTEENPYINLHQIKKTKPEIINDEGQDTGDVKENPSA